MERSSRRQRNCTSRRNRSVYGQSRAGRHSVQFAVDHVHPGQRGLCRVHRIGPAGPEPANRSAALHPASPLEAGVYPGGGGSVSPRVEGGEAKPPITWSGIPSLAQAAAKPWRCTGFLCRCGRSPRPRRRPGSRRPC